MEKVMYKKAYRLGLLVYMFMLALSVLFYKERAILSDSAYDLFHVLRGVPDYNMVRFAGFVPKLAAIAAVKAGAGISGVLLSYSVATVLFYFIIYCICGSVLKKYEHALIVLLCNVLVVSECFYYIPSELPQGMAFFALFLAVLPGIKEGSIARHLCIILFTIVLGFFHPLMLFVLGYSAVFFWFRNQAGISRKTLLEIVAVFSVLVLLKMFVIRTQYEQHSMSGLKNFVTQFPHYFTLYSDRQFLHHCFTEYYWIPLIFFFAGGFYFVHKQWARLLFFAGSVAGYILLVNISYPSKETASYYMENLYLPVSMFLALPLVFDVLPAPAVRRFALPLFVLIIATFCVRIYAGQSVFGTRLNEERKVLAEYDEKKIILSSKRVNTDVLQMLWPAPYELLLLSACEKGKAASVIIDDDPGRRPWAANERKSLIVNWNTFPYRMLPGKYFHFTDTLSGYTVDTLKK